MNSILSVMDVLKNELLREQLRTSPFPEDVAVKSGINNEDDGTNKLKGSNKTDVVISKAAAAATSKKSRIATRASAIFMRSANVALAAGGALSAASILLETVEMTRVTNKMIKGSPCQKADFIREIKKEVEQLPDTRIIAEECERFFDMMVAKPASSERGEEVKRDVMDQRDMIHAINSLELQTRMNMMADEEPTKYPDDTSGSTIK
mmetsp:Transcript_10029/g.14642  ORF Transcript_10029/g.14642 Transcript_10029/m.14642 type:complete len:207 (+) Transcript_10029:1-621(+)